MGELRHKRILIPIYSHIVELYYGDGKDFEDTILKKYNCSFDNFDRYTNGYSAILEKNTGKYDELHLILFLSSFDNPDKKLVHTIHHEAIHTAYFILDRVGVKISEDNHETLTYLSGYIAQEVDDQIDKWKKP